MPNVKCKTILFLGYNSTETKIINVLTKMGCKVDQTSAKIVEFPSKYDLVISFGYKHILSKDIFSECKVPILNLHMSLLPWNRGANPNFWSFWDNTPSGVTIHLMEPKVDSGPIIFQKNIYLDENLETFKSSYEKLFNELENLFIKNLNSILNLNFTLKAQRGAGTFHYKKDFPKDFRGWDENISDEIKRLEINGFNPTNRLLSIIDEIEKARSRNNVNWMNLLRVVAVLAPDKLSEITSSINGEDGKISELLKKLSEN